MLLQIDTQFWSREIADDKGRFRRVDEAYAIDSFCGKPIETFLKKVIVPKGLRAQAESLFGHRIEALEK
ncbi:MAG: hypothetical protein WCC90_05810 [Methylocella sp.]